MTVVLSSHLGALMWSKSRY